MDDYTLGFEQVMDIGKDLRKMEYMLSRPTIIDNIIFSPIIFGQWQIQIPSNIGTFEIRVIKALYNFET